MIFYGLIHDCYAHGRCVDPVTELPGGQKRLLEKVAERVLVKVLDKVLEKRFTENQKSRRAKNTV